MTDRNDVVIVSAVRTPFSRFDSAMADIPSIDLGVMVMKEAVSRVALNPEEIDEIYYGSCIPAELALETDVPARQATLLAGFPEEIPGMAVPFWPDPKHTHATRVCTVGSTRAHVVCRATRSS